MFKSRVLIASFAVVAAAPVIKTAADPPANPPATIAPAVSPAPPLLPPPPPPPSAILGNSAPVPTPTSSPPSEQAGNNGAPSPVASSAPGGRTPAATTSQAGAVDWPMMGGSALRYNVYPTGVDTTRLSLSWQYATPGNAATTIAPVAVNGVVYLAAGSSVYALSAETGEQLWPAPFTTKSLDAEMTESPAISSSPAYANGYLFVGAVNGILYVLDAITGKVVQGLPVGSSITSSPTVTHGLVVVATEGGTAVAFSLPAPGRPMARVWIRPLSPTDAISGPAAVLGDSIYFTTDAGKAFAVDVRTGVVQAGAQSEGASFRFGPLPSPGGIFAVSGRKLYLLNSFGLRQSWVQSFPDDIAAQPAFSNGIFYLVLANGDLFAFSPERRTALWSVSLGANSSPKAPPLVAGDSIIVPTANGHVYAFAAAGAGGGHARLLWQYMAPPTPIYARNHPFVAPDIAAEPVVYGQQLFILASNGTLNCLSSDAVDDDGPMVQLRFPEGGPYPSETAPHIMAQVLDPGSGYQRGSLKLSLDGNPIPAGFRYDPNTGRLDYVVPRPLAEGTHTVEVSASDIHGNTKTSKWSFELARSAGPIVPTGFGGGYPGGGIGSSAPGSAMGGVPGVYPGTGFGGG